MNQSNAARLMAREGAKHIYLLDFSDQVTAFAKALQADFPETKVCSDGQRCKGCANGNR